MSHLTVYPDTDPETVLIDTADGNSIAAELAGIGVDFARWEASVALAPDADQAAVLAAYDHDVQKLIARSGYVSVDVARVTPAHPDKSALRQKFLSEHTHNEDEIRFFVEGSGAFYLHTQEKVFRVLCERNDLISVPAGITHWFDTGPNPNFCAIRMFMTPDGWVGHFTGSDIATRFPLYEN